MITCIFGLTACGSEETQLQRDRDQATKQEAEQRAQYVVYILANLINDKNSQDVLSGRSSEEIEYIIYENFEIRVDGYGFSTAIDSFASAVDSIGDIKDADGMPNFGEIKSEINGNQVIVKVELIGADRNAEAEIIFSNDIFLQLESAALNPESGMGELMTGAALNTVIGMGTVFAVLILISAIISCFKVIPALQKKAADRKAGAVKETKSESPVVQSSVQEENTENDLELAAVIAAAIAAYEGSASTDGYVVRSIRRRWS